MNKLELGMNSKEPKRDAIVYTCTIENNFLFANFEEQNSECLEYISENNYNLIRQYNEKLIENIDIYERNEFRKMLHDIEKYDIKNSILIIYSYKILVKNILSIATFIESLTERQIHLICLSDNINALSSSGLASLQMWVCIDNYIKSQFDENFVLFSGKNDSRCDAHFCKGFFKKNGEYLQKLLLTVSKDDEWFHVCSSGNLKILFKYNCKEGNTIKNEIEEIMEKIFD